MDPTIIRRRVAVFEAARRLRSTTVVSGQRGVDAVVEGRPVVVFCSNDYLGLRGHPRVLEAAHAALDDQGAGAGSSRLIAGTLPCHEELEDALARHFGSETALVMSSGYHANLALLSTLCADGDLLVSDRLNHASIIDGCRLSRARVQVVPHGDVAALRGIRPPAPPALTWVVVEGLYSMDGDQPDLRAVVEATERAGGALIVDEAHAVGTVGELGRGAAFDQGVADRVAVRVGTFGKALGSHGAFVLCDTDTRQLLINGARSFIYSTALAPANAAAAGAALGLLRDENWRIHKLQQLSRQLWDGVRELGLQTGPSPSPIVPVIVGEESTALAVAEQLLERGIFARAIRPPTVPEGTCRIRFTLSALHEEDHVAQVLQALALFARSHPIPRREGWQESR